MQIKKILLKTDLSQRYLRDYLFRFFRETKFNNNYIFVLTKVSMDDERIVRTFGQKTLLDITNKSEINNYVDQVTKYFLDHKDSYYPQINDSILICYLETNETIYTKYQRNISLNKEFDKEISEGIIAPHNIPFNTIYSSWGDIKIINHSTSIINNIKFNDNIDYIKINKLNFDQTLIKVIFKNKKYISFIDTNTRKDLDNIKRVYSENDLIVYFVQNKPFFSFDSKSFAPKFELDKDGKPTNKRTDVINSLLPTVSIKNNKFITLDTETFLDNGSFQLLSISFAYFDSCDITTNSFYRGDCSSSTNLLNSAFDELFTCKFDKSYVYIHNGSKFDLVFIVKYLLTRDDIQLYPMYKDGKFISLIIDYGKTKDNKGRIKYSYSLGIRDSMLLLPSSLEKLGKAFGVETQKDIYPYYFPNKNNLNYIGAVPEYKFFDSKKVSIIDYNNYVNRFEGKDWCLRNETINYCDKDCISLLQVINNFIYLIFNKFGVDVLECPTLPSLAFRIFRSNYLKDNTLPLIDKKLYDDLVKAYFGGHVDLYIPKGPIYPEDKKLTVNQIRKLINEKGIDLTKTLLKTIKHYDVNSLFPSAMKDFKYPTDILGKFIGDLRYISEFSHYFNDNLGIYKVKVTAPDIKNPLLPMKVNNQLLYPYGTWTGWYFSEEIKNAEKYGYSFEILGGYVFDSTDLFSNYINDLYKIKETSNKGGALYLISKLLLNSLYGKMALCPHLNDYSFTIKSDFNNKIKDDKFKERIQDWIDFDSHYLVGFKNLSNHVLTNIAVGLAVTSYSRIIMSQFKNKENLTLFYSDTDSLFVDNYLPESVVDNKKLGLYKLEAEYFIFIAIGPKVYGAMDIFGNEYTKVKGFKDKINLEILESLLDKDKSHNLTQEKWFKSMKDGNISIKLSPYDLKPNNNKRIIIYKNNKFVSTENVLVSEGNRINFKDN